MTTTDSRPVSSTAPMTVSVRTLYPSLVRSAAVGAIAGLGGGAVFGMMMGMMGMLPMVAALVGSQDPFTGFGVHMAISAAIGVVYGLVARRLPQNLDTALLAGAVNGAVWWVLGALILMPLLLGMGNMVLQIGHPQGISLVGHLVYGVVTGVIFMEIIKRD